MPPSSQGPPHSKCHVPTTGSDKACKILLDITDRAKNFTGHFYTSPETLQPTPFLYRALSTNALKTFSSAIEQKKLLELIHPIISDSIALLSTSGIGIHLANQPKQPYVVPLLISV